MQLSVFVHGFISEFLLSYVWQMFSEFSLEPVQRFTGFHINELNKIFQRVHFIIVQETILPLHKVVFLTTYFITKKG